MKKTWGLLFMILFVLNLTASDIKLVKNINLDDMSILQPAFMKVKDGVIYIFDKGNTKFYIIKKHKLYKSFGRKGQGPGEFTIPLSFGFINKEVYIYDMSRRIIYFDMNGGFFREKKVGGDNIYFYYEKLPENRVLLVEMLSKGMMSGERVLFLKEGAKKIKIASSFFSLKQTFNLGNSSFFDWTVDGNNLYLIPNKNQFKIELFDMSSKKFHLFIFKRDYKRVKYTKDEIREMKTKYEKLKRTNPFFAKLKVKFPEYKPAIKDLLTNGKGQIFIVTNEKQKGKYKVEIYDKNKKFIGNIYIPRYISCYIENNKIYLIKDTEEGYLLCISVVS